MLFGLNDVFHSVWFVILTIVLCVNLLGCNLIHFPKLMKRIRSGFNAQARVDRAEREMEGAARGPEEELSAEKSEAAQTQSGEAQAKSGQTQEQSGADDAQAREAASRTHAGCTPDAGAVFRTLGFRRIENVKTASGRSALYSVKNKIGIWGAWLCHLGMLVVIAGFALGQMMKSETSVYGVPGQTKLVEGTRYALTIDDFEITLREDETVEQYTASVTMTDTQSGEKRSGQCSVNAPLNLFGYKLYQNSTGWAAALEISKGEEVIQEEILCAGEYVPVQDLPELVVTLAAFYPDYAADEQGKPMTLSPEIRNPAYLYRIYYKDQVLGMNLLTEDDVITVEDYVFRFKDPRSYTLIQIKRDPFTPVAAAGGLLVICGLFLAFYLQTAEIWAVQRDDGDWSVWAHSRKGGSEFLESVRRKCGQLNAAEEKTE